MNASNPCWQYVQLQAHGVFRSKIADVHGIEVHEVGTWKFVYFRKIFLFLLHITRGVTRGSRDTIPRAPNHCGGPKSHNNVISTSFSIVHLLPTDLRFEHRGVKLVSCPRRHLTSLRLCTSRLSSQNGEICLQKYLPISGKLSTTNYLNKMLLIQSHLISENNLKVEKRYIISKTSTTFPLPRKKRLGYAER